MKDRAKTIGILWDIVGKNYGIYWIKLWNIMGKSYEFLMGYSGQKLWD